MVLTSENAPLFQDARDMADAEAVMRKLEAGETEAFPFEVAERLLDGDHPVTVFRELRGLNGRALADKASLSPSYLSEIETGRKAGSLNAMARIAKVLDVSIDLLVPEQDEGEEG